MLTRLLTSSPSSLSALISSNKRSFFPIRDILKDVSFFLYVPDWRSSLLSASYTLFSLIKSLGFFSKVDFSVYFFQEKTPNNLLLRRLCIPQGNSGTRIFIKILQINLHILNPRVRSANFFGQKFGCAKKNSYLCSRFYKLR